MRTPRFLAVALAVCLAACTGNAEDSGPSGKGDSGKGDSGGGDDTAVDSGGDTGGDTGQDTGDDTGTDLLPDARDGMVRSGEDCEVIGGHTDVPAARLWYWGELTGEPSGGFTGVEAWYFFGNSSWYARGLEDCEVHYDLSEIEIASAGACATCDFGVRLTADVNLDRTTCPASLYRGYEQMKESYAIEELGDGSASWYFPTSGNALGDGYWTAAGVNYLADDGCTLPVD
jgi:hypothetical protein